MVGFIYGLYFDGISNFSEKLYSPQTGAEGVKYAKYLVDLYVTAEKYEVANLRMWITSIFPTVLERLYRASATPSQDVYPSEIDEVIRYIFGTHSRLASKFISAISRFMVDNMQRFTHAAGEPSKFHDLIVDHPELGYQLVVVLQAKRS
jgi:hypothetical protein